MTYSINLFTILIFHHLYSFTFSSWHIQSQLYFSSIAHIGHFCVFFINSGLFLTIKNFSTLSSFRTYNRIRNHLMIQLCVYIYFSSLEISLSRLSQFKHLRTSILQLIPQHSTIIMYIFKTTYKSFNLNMGDSYPPTLYFHCNSHNRVIPYHHYLLF